MKKQDQRKLVAMAVEEIDKCIAKIEATKKSIRERPNGMSAEDIAKRVMNTLDNCKGQMKALKQKASRK